MCQLASQKELFSVGDLVHDGVESLILEDNGADTSNALN